MHLRCEAFLLMVRFYFIELDKILCPMTVRRRKGDDDRFCNVGRKNRWGLPFIGLRLLFFWNWLWIILERNFQMIILPSKPLSSLMSSSWSFCVICILCNDLIEKKWWWRNHLQTIHLSNLHLLKSFMSLLNLLGFVSVVRLVEIS